MRATMTTPPLNREQRRKLARDARRDIRTDRNATRAVPAMFFNPILYSKTYTEEQAAEICNTARMAWHRITTGDGSRDDFDTIAEVCNTTLVRAEQLGNGQPLVDAVLQAQASLIELQNIIRRTGRVAPNAGTLRTVPDLLDMYFELLRNSTAHQMVAACKEARRRVNQQIKQEKQA